MKYTLNLDTGTTFLIANGNRHSGAEVSKALGMSAQALAHDSISRWLLTQTVEPSDLWKQVQKSAARQLSHH